MDELAEQLWEEFEGNCSAYLSDEDKELFIELIGSISQRRQEAEEEAMWEAEG